MDGRALSSGGERFPDTEEVRGSNPLAPTISRTSKFARLLASLPGECDTYARFRLDVRIARSGEGDGATRARAVAHIFVVLSSCDRARSSVGERLLHTQEVAGSKPAAPTP